MAILLGTGEPGRSPYPATISPMDRLSTKPRSQVYNKFTSGCGMRKCALSAKSHPLNGCSDFGFRNLLRDFLDDTTISISGFCTRRVCAASNRDSERKFSWFANRIHSPGVAVFLITETSQTRAILSLNTCCLAPRGQAGVCLFRGE